MNDQTNDRCKCLNCSGQDCQCGCQTAMAALPTSYAQHCTCPGSCGCEGGEQGCLCQH